MHWLFPYMLLAFGLCASAALFMSVKQEMRASAVRNRSRLDEIAKRLEEAHARPPEPIYIPPAAPHSAMNINKRVQAMRMVRRNEDVSHIAAVLGVTRKEVELLIHVHKMSAGR